MEYSLYNNINTRLNAEEHKGKQPSFDIEIITNGIKAFNLSDIEYARVKQALKILDSKRFKEVKE